jgi:hypothetical protein
MLNAYNILLLFPLIFVDTKQHDTIMIGDSQACALSNLSKNDGISTYCKVSSQIEWWEKNLPENSKNSSTAIIMLGSNNCDSTSIGNSAINLVKKLNTGRCIWVMPPKIRGNICVVSSMIEKSLEDKCEIIDSSMLNIKQVDGVHPTISGAKFWWSEIQKLIKE